jgi:hypothetical protein
MFGGKNKNSEKEKKILGSTQKFLAVDHIKDDVLVLKDKSLRSALLVSSINMELRTEEEQEIIISSYQGMLNSLNFPIQVLVQSRRVDLSSYLATLKESEIRQTVSLLKEQTSEYISFLEDILSNVNVMDKKFFVIIPHFPNIVAQESVGILSFFGGKKQTGASNYAVDIRDLGQKTQIVISLLQSMGLNATQLPTEALVELFYSYYNPGVSEHEHIENIDSLGAEYISTRESVKKGLEE